LLTIYGLYLYKHEKIPHHTLAFQVSMTRDTLLKLIILSGTILSSVLLMLCNGLTFPTEELFIPLRFAGPVIPFAIFFRSRKASSFTATTLGLMFLLLYLPCFSILMYASTPISAPFIDGWLVSADSMLGVSLNDVVLWAHQHSTIAYCLKIVYGTVFMQTILLLFLLGFLREDKAINRFVLQFLMSLSIVAAIFMIAPAEGPFVAYGYEPSITQAEYLQQLHNFRSGAVTEISLTTASGLVTFPSFHTTWAILLAAAFWQRKKLFIPMLLLNIAVVLATLTTGWHYLTDVIGGGLLAAIVITVSYRLEPWLQQECFSFVPAEMSWSNSPAVDTK